MHDRPHTDRRARRKPKETCIIRQTLHQFAARRTPVCFYPSFGRDWSTIDQLPERYSVVCDYIRYRELFERAERSGHRVVHETDAGAVFRTAAGRVTVYVQAENAHALELLRVLGVQVSTFVGVDDGCSEGGNYECTNDVWFLRDVLSVATFPLRYYTNHFVQGVHCDANSTLQGHRWWAVMDMGAGRAPCHTREWSNPRELRQGWFLGSKRFSMRRRLSLTLRETRRRVPCFEITDTQPTIQVGAIGGLEVTIEQENFANGLLEVDGYFGTRGAQRQLGFYGILPDRARVVDGLSQRDAYDITKELLQIADAHGMETVACMPFGNGEHRGLVQALHEYEQQGGGALKKLRLLHLDRDDFADIRELFRPEVQRTPPPPSPPRPIPERERICHALPLDLC